MHNCTSKRWYFTLWNINVRKLVCAPYAGHWKMNSPDTCMTCGRHRQQSVVREASHNNRLHRPWLRDQRISNHCILILTCQLKPSTTDWSQAAGFGRQPLTPPPRGTLANIRIYLIIIETRIIGLYFAAHSLGLSSFKFSQTDGQTDGQTTYCGITALCIASRGKNVVPLLYVAVHYATWLTENILTEKTTRPSK